MKIRDRIKSLRRVKASELMPNPRNWRMHPDSQQDAMKGILADVGWADAVLVRETPEGLQLIDGHLRADVAPDSKVPCLVLDVDEAEADMILATHDPLGAMAEANGEQLESLLADIETDNEALQAMLDELAADSGLDLVSDEIVEDEVPEPPADPITKPGDLWILGDHRLLCGDSTKAEDVERVMGGEKAELMNTDPPYGVDFEGAKYNPRAKEWEGIDGDQRQGVALESWLTDCIRLWVSFVGDTAAFYFWTAAMEEGAAAAAAIRNVGLHIQSQIIWNKNTLVLGQADYHWKHENCWYAFWKGKKHRWFGERDKTTVWEVAKVANVKYQHPMQKPVELYAIPIRHHTKESELVADPFCGSGTQFIAAEQLNRRCYGIEIAPQYVDVCVERWQNLTGKKAKRNGRK